MRGTIIRVILVYNLMLFGLSSQGVAQIEDPVKLPPEYPIEPIEPKLPMSCPSDDLCIIPAASTILVPSQAPTIQKAIERIQTQGTVLVRAGTYRENIHIPEGKHIIIKSSGGWGETHLRPHDATKPTVTIDPGAKACLIELSIEGRGNIGIQAGEFLEGIPTDGLLIGPSAGVEDSIPSQVGALTNQTKALRRLGRPATAVALRGVKALRGDRGLLIFADQIELCDSEASDNCGWGAALIGAGVLINGFILQNNGEGGLGLLDGGLCSSPAAGEIVVESVTIDGLYASFNDGPGLAICGANNVTVRNSGFYLNQLSGIYVFDSNNVVLDPVSANNTEAVGGLLGDGVVVLSDSDVEIRNSDFSFNDRCGLYYNASGSEIRNNFITFNLFAICLESGADPLITDDNFMSGNERNEVVVGQDLEPPPPVEPAQD